MADYELNSVARVKRRAKEIKRATGSQAHRCAAREAGFDNYDRAREQLLEAWASAKTDGATEGVADWVVS
ncbi:MAG: hypothetical protein K2Y20_13960 [Sphingomonas sp.]|nr:hypothetical protein [Sphingomonas sp.]